MIEEWGPSGRRPRFTRRRPGADERTGNAIFDGVDDDPVAYATLMTLAGAFCLVLAWLVAL